MNTITRNNRACIYPGSFDPISLGHFDIIQRISNIFDDVYIAILKNANKKALFSAEERIAFIAKACKDIDNIHIIKYDGLLNELAESIDCYTIIRGIRGISDMEGEMFLANNYKMLNPKLETLLIPCSSKYFSLSSSLIRELLNYGKSLDGFIPQEINDDIIKSFRRK